MSQWTTQVMDGLARDGLSCPHCGDEAATFTDEGEILGYEAGEDFCCNACGIIGWIDFYDDGQPFFDAAGRCERDVCSACETTPT